MYKTLTAVLAVLALGFAVAFSSSPATAGDVKSLRGGKAIPALTASPILFKTLEPDKVYPRNHQHEPPRLPHEPSDYDINLQENACLACHDKGNYKEAQAPMAGKSHFVEADGSVRDSVIKRRYYCKQCHVPQADTTPLVDNTYQSAK